MMKPRDALDLVLLAAVFGASFLFMRMGAPEFGPFVLIELRLAIGALVLLPILALRGGLRLLRAHAMPLFLLGAVNSGIPFTLWGFALLSMSAGVASILNATTPMFGALMAAFWLGDRLSRVQIAGLAVGFLGVVALVGSRASLVHVGGGLAVAAALGATFLYGIAVCYAKKRFSGVDPLAISAGSLLGAALLLLPFAVVSLPERMPGTAAWVGVLALGALCTGFAYILYFRLIASIGPARAVAVTFLVPVFGVFWGALFLGESITGNMIAGMVVILLGTALATKFVGGGAEKSA